jgi:hypothetical protein
LAAMALALAVAVPGTARPALAEDDGGVSDQVIDLVFTALRIFSNGGPSLADVERLVRETVGAVNGVKTETLGQIDGFAAGVVIGQAENAANTMEDYTIIRQDELMLWDFGQTLGQYADNASAMYGSVLSRKAKDQIGLAANTIYPVALVVRKEAGAINSLPTYERKYRELNQRIVAELEPTCISQVTDGTPLFISEVHFTCTAANGDVAHDYQVRNEMTGQWLVPQVDLNQLKREAAINSSWVVAKEVLEGP